MLGLIKLGQEMPVEADDCNPPVLIFELMGSRKRDLSASPETIGKGLWPMSMQTLSGLAHFTADEDRRLPLYYAGRQALLVNIEDICSRLWNGVDGRRKCLEEAFAE